MDAEKWIAEERGAFDGGVDAREMVGSAFEFSEPRGGVDLGTSAAHFTIWDRLSERSRTEIRDFLARLET